ncbi:MAG: hypothetical protein K2Q06_15985 [Parvularculaceae bacterium]|nr:hypothetical protein [Parvularculaceae bacterium]
MAASSWLSPTLGLLSNTPHQHGPFSVFRKSAQGAAAGMLGFSGAGGLGAGGAGGASTITADHLSSIDGFIGGLASGAFNGPLQLLAAAAVFLAAGRCVARMFGLGAVVLAYVAYASGVRWEDVSPIAASLGVRFAAAWQAFLNPPV